MMSKKINQCSALDQSEHDQPPGHCQVDRSANAALGCRGKAESAQRNGETASSSPESGSLNGDGKRSGKSRRRKKRSSNPEGLPEGKVENKTKTEEKPDNPRAGLVGLQSECANVWLERSIYERAESLYQCWLASSSNGTTKSNRSPSAPGKQSNSSSNGTTKSNRSPSAPGKQPNSSSNGTTKSNQSPPAPGKQPNSSSNGTTKSNRSPPAPGKQPNSSSNGTTKSNRSSPAPGKQSNPPSTVAPSSSGPVCHHADQVACHHVVQAVWVNKTTFDQAERRYVEESVQLPVPNSLDLPSPPNRASASRTPDEGYQSLAPTPATPAAVTPTNRQSVNGLPRVPTELLRDVWLEKPQYDRAEAAFYQNLYGNNSSKRSCASTSRSGDHPQSLVEEEEEDEEVAVEEKVVAPQGKAEIFHALLPIQEEEEPAEGPEKDEASKAGICYFIHPDSERVWLDKWRYDAAEARFHGYNQSQAVVVKKGRRPEASSRASSAPLRDNTMSSGNFLAQEKIWFDKPRYDEAERRFYERSNGSSQPATQDVGANTILQDIARARENIQKSLAGSSSGAADQGEIICRIKSLELENHSLHKVVDDLRAALSKLESRVSVLEKSPAVVPPAAAPSIPYTNGTTVQKKVTPPAKDKEEEEDEDDFDLFGSDDDDEEAEQLKQERLKEYAEKKAKKPGLIAKSSILLDVKPWDDETDMVKLEECVRSIQADGLLWGTSKLVPVGYGIKKLQIACVVEDDKVGTDMLEEEITKFEDYIQSVDVAAFNKI